MTHSQNTTERTATSSQPVEGNKIIHLRVYPARNTLATYLFLREVLRRCEVEEIVLDRGPWYRIHVSFVRFRHEVFGEFG